MGKKQSELPNLTRNPFPHDIEIEEATLGALMIEPHAIMQVVDWLKPEMFSEPEHQEIYKAIMALYEKGDPIDILTVADKLRRLGTLEKIGGPSRICHITMSIVSSAHLQYHSAVTQELYMRRELIRTNEMHTLGSMDMTIDLGDQINAQRLALDTIESHVGEDTLRTLVEVTEATLKEGAQRIQNNKNGLTGIPTGLDELNRLTAGWQNGNLMILAGRPSMGKTALSLCMAWEAARAGHHVLYCSIEMNAERLMDRWLFGETDIDPYRWQGGQSTPEELEKVLGIRERVREMPIHVDDNPIQSMDYIFSKARMLKQKGQCDIVFVDYLQLCQLRSGNRNDTRAVIIGEATRKAKLMAKKLGIPVVLLSQLNRKPEDRPDKRPELSDLRDSGQIEQDADLVMIVHRPEQAGMKEDKESGFPVKEMGILIIAKNRHGATGNIYFGHNPSLTRIGDYTPTIEWMKQNLEKIDTKKLRDKYKN